MVLPDMLRGVCVAQLPEASMLPVTGFVAALGGVLLIRTAGDFYQGVRPGDARESGRLMLQWCLTIGLTPLLWFGLDFLGRAGWAPAPGVLGPWLRCCLGFYGAMLTIRALLRATQAIYARDVALTPSIAELDRRAPVDEAAVLAPMLTLERREPESRALSGSNIPGFVVGALLLAIAVVGWNMRSLCLFRLPQ